MPVIRQLQAFVCTERGSSDKSH